MIGQNNRNRSHWSLESGYKTEYTENEYPKRIFAMGRKEALELVLSSYKQDRDFMCNAQHQGFVFYLNVPGETVEARNFLQTEFFEDTLVSIKPKLITTSNGLRNYKPMQRGCFFNSERQLRFFKSYTKYNCNIECVTNFTRKICGCVKFSMPSMHQP